MINCPETETAIPNRKVLVIAHYFPPAGGVGTFRVAKFVKYLPDFGWLPAVVTTLKSTHPWQDKNLEADIPQNVHIYRLPSSKIPLVHDEGIRWIPNVLLKIGTILKKEKPLIIYLTGGPFFPLSIGLFIKIFYKIPYVIDLRDPWRPARNSYTTRVSIKLRIARALTDIVESLIIKHASKIICATEPMRQDYLALYKKVQSSKFITITNGFDPVDFEHIKPVKLPEFSVIYTGKFKTAAGFRDPTTFFQAIHLLNSEGIRILFFHIGQLEPEISTIAKNTNISTTVNFVGPKSHLDTLAYTKGANLLLIIGTGQLYEQTGKIFDYIGSRKPILAIAPHDGAIAEVIQQVPNSKLISKPEPIEIANFIREMYSYKKAYSYNYNEFKYLRHYHRDYLTQILATTLNMVISV